MKTNIHEALITIAEKHLDHVKASHRWDHTLRVYRLAYKIGELEGANLEVVGYAALLHDIGRSREDESAGEVDHAQEGGRMARNILKDLDMEETKIREVVHCIETHRFRDDNQPQTLEAKVLYDADKLDSIGAVGIGRAFLFSGEVGARLHNKTAKPEETDPYSPEDTAYREYLVKLSKIKDRMLTSTGKKLALERHRFMEEFFERFKQEIEGEI
jgi:uncharacterized protein